MILSEAEKLEQQGKKLLAKRDFKGAEEKFTAALNLEERTHLRNNLALSVYLQGETERALQILEPCLNADSILSQPNPFSHALAAELLAALGESERGHQQLNAAIRLFEKGIKELEGLKADLTGWREYTIRIMKAAAALGDHRKVFELYRRWEKYHISWENRYLAGIAAFNMGMYTRAASMWSSLKEAGEFVLGMQQVAIMVDRGTVPPFQLQYETYSREDLKEMMLKASSDEEARAQLVSDGMVRMILLTFALRPDIEEEIISSLLETLIVYGGEWGKEMGFNLLRSTGVTNHMKIAAAEALIKSGALQENEPINMVIDGRERLVELKKVEISLEPSEEIEKMMKKVKGLMEQKQLPEAIAVLEKFMQEGHYHPSVMLTLASLYTSVEEFDKALSLLNILEKIFPGEPFVLFNLASLWLQRGDSRKAREYLEQIILDGQREDFIEKCKFLMNEIELMESLVLPEDVDDIVFELEEKRRMEIEAKSLPLDATLARGLKNMPVNWLNGMVEDYNLPEVRLRKDREEEIIRFLSQPRNLKRVLKEDLNEEERELLRYLLEKGGWARLSAVTRKFGPMEGDGFSWEEYPPDSSLGYLWSRGLVMVGRTVINGRNTKFVTVPQDLREIMAPLLGVTLNSGSEKKVKSKNEGNEGRG